MLGREPVIRHQNPGAGSESEMAGRLSPGGRSTDHISAAKKVEDRPLRTFTLNRSPEAINFRRRRVSNSGRFAGQILGEQIRFARLGERHLDLLRKALEQAPKRFCLLADHRDKET